MNDCLQHCQEYVSQECEGRQERRPGSPQECARVAERDAGRCQRRRGSQEARGVEACETES